jgi:hypothetical protein
MQNQRTGHSFVSDWNDLPEPPAFARPDYKRRALSIWPGLDRTRLGRAHDDPLRIARLAATRTSLPIETILVLLLGADEPGRSGWASGVQ